jgi:Raf kinase inhibitor-like YbhB/YbcL family protein
MRLTGTICAAALTVAACGTDGRELREPAASSPDGAGETDQPEAGSEPEATRGEFVFSTPAFPSGGAIPVAHTCDGDDLSPELSWEGVPVGAAELAVVVSDPEANFFTHWVITGLPANSTGIEAGEVPAGAVEARNDVGTVGWTGPCPPANHTYLFSLHVLPEPLGMVPDLEAPVAVGLVESATIQAISFTGSYGPAGQ